MMGLHLSHSLQLMVFSRANIPPPHKIAEAAPISDGSNLGAHPPLLLDIKGWQPGHILFAYLEGTF